MLHMKYPCSVVNPVDSEEDEVIVLFIDCADLHMCFTITVIFWLVQVATMYPDVYKFNHEEYESVYMLQCF